MASSATDPSRRASSRLAKARSLVESSHSLLKDCGGEDIANPRKRPGRGFTFHHLAAALAAATTNLRKVETFYVQDYDRSVEPQHRTRRRNTLTVRR
jgi:hypothetical protein